MNLALINKSSNFKYKSHLYIFEKNMIKHNMMCEHRLPLGSAFLIFIQLKRLQRLLFTELLTYFRDVTCPLYFLSRAILIF